LSECFHNWPKKSQFEQQVDVLEPALEWVVLGAETAPEGSSPSQQHSRDSINIIFICKIIIFSLQRTYLMLDDTAKLRINKHSYINHKAANTYSEIMIYRI
jgi:hypothetical protein